MRGKNGCECDYSYTCHQCQQRIDMQNQIDYATEVQDWIIESIRLIAAEQGVNLPAEPKPRGRY